MQQCDFLSVEVSTKVRISNTTEATAAGDTEVLQCQNNQKTSSMQGKAKEMTTNPPTSAHNEEVPLVTTLALAVPATECTELPSQEKSERKEAIVEAEMKIGASSATNKETSQECCQQQNTNVQRKTPLTGVSTVAEAKSYEDLPRIQIVTHLEEGFYDVVVFCLLLEYIPSPKQRFLCCQKAYNLLRLNGILCIVTPDSKHQNANVHLYKLWKITLGYLGFSRTKYEKQTHFHGMVFRKGLCKEAWELDADRELSVTKKTNVRNKFLGINYENINSEIYIPQDFQDLSESEEEGS